MTAPTSLFFVNNADELMPLGIQLHPGETGHPDPVLTPNDDPNTWLGMKIHACCADGMIHAIYSHLILLHFVMCNVWTSANRSLPPEHPIHAFLKPHFWSTLVITKNVKGTIDKSNGLLCRITGFGYTGQNEVIPRLFDEFDFSHFVPQTDFERRGVDDRKKLPNFFYRDDSLRLWEADLSYVRSMMDLFYRSDDDVRGDSELQAWVAEMPSPSGGAIRGLPVGSTGGLETREQLHELLAAILFTVTSRHSSTEVGAERYVYPPANPFSYRLPAPLRSTDQFSLRAVSDLLPTLEHSILAKVLIQAADFAAKNFRGIGKYPADFTASWPEGAEQAISAWQRALADISTEIAARNEKLETPYEGMNPRYTFNSIWN